MVGGVISDIYHAQDRNTPMALFSAAALFGTGLAPLISGVIVSHTTWRWIYYTHAIVSGFFVIIIFVFFQETRGSVLLSRKANALNTYYEGLEAAGHYGVIMPSEGSDEKCVRRIRWKVKSDEQRASLAKMIQISLYRPFRKSFLFPMDASHPAYHLIIRYASHRTGRFLLFSLGLLQLGRAISAIRLRPTRLPDEPQLYHRAIRRRVHRY